MDHASGCRCSAASATTGSTPAGRMQFAPANPFVPERNVPAADCQPCWKDWSIRAGASYDLFGTGKTALKTSVGKFLAAERARHDLDRSTRSAAQSEHAHVDRPRRQRHGDRRRRQHPDQRDRRADATTTSARRPARCRSIRTWSAATTGKKRSRSSTSCSANMSVTGGYYRRQFYNIAAEPNLAVDPDLDYTPFTIVGPTHPNLPNGGGELITLYNLNPNKQGAVEQRPHQLGRTVARLQRLRGERQRAVPARVRVRRHHDRARGDRQLRGPERTRTACRFCSRVPPFRTSTRRRPATCCPYDIQLAGSFQARPGIPIGADWTVDSATSVAQRRRAADRRRQQHHRRPGRTRRRCSTTTSTRTT